MIQQLMLTINHLWSGACGCTQALLLTWANQIEMVTFPMVHCINPCIELYIGVKLCMLTSDLLTTVDEVGHS